MAQSYPEQEDPSTPPVDSAGRPRAPEIKPPSGSRRFAYRLFNRETRSGRFFRSLLNGLLFFVILAGIGALAVYLLLYRPLDERLNETQAQAAQTTADLEQAQKDLAAARNAQKAAEARAEQDQDRLVTELTRVQILRALGELKTAKVAIYAEDKEAAEQAMDSAETITQQASARLNRIEPNASSTLDALFTLVRNGLDRDLELASADLDRLLAELTRLDSALK